MSEKLIRTIFEQIAGGKLDRKAGAELLKELKKAEVMPARDEMAIIGMSARLPGANDLEQFWSNLREGKDSIGAFPKERRRDVDGLKQFTYMKDMEVDYSVAGYLDRIDSFDYSFFGISPKEASLMDPNQRLFLQVAWHALEDAGYGGRRLSGTRTGLYIGYSGWPMYGQFVSYTEPDSFDMAVSGNISAIIASRIPHELDLKGPSMLVDTACSSSLVALHLACKAIQAGDCDQALVGGLRLALLPLDGYVKYGIEASDSRAKAFDDQADGTGLSEGVVAVLIKPLRKALNDGDSIYAVIKGSAINQDGTSINITAPNALAQEDVILNAWKDGDIDPATISYIEAHGTGTKLGDPIEIDGIQKAFRRYTSKRQFCAIGSLKSNIGHTDAAAGLAGIVKAALALHHKEIPPTLHFRYPNRQIGFVQSPVFVNDRLTPWDRDESHPRRCGVSSFGFSGTNAHVVLEEAPSIEQSIETTVQSEKAGHRLFVVSAHSRTALNALVTAYKEMLERKPQLSLEQLCYSACTGRGHYMHRIAIPLQSTSELHHALTEWCHGKETSVKLFYGVHRVLSAGRARRDDTEVTETDIRERTRQANQLVEAAVEKGEPLNMEQLQELARLYVGGADVFWEKTIPAGKPGKIRLPLYPFDATRCWFKLPEAPIGSPETSIAIPFRESDYYRDVFEKDIPFLELGERNGRPAVDRRTEKIEFKADESLATAVRQLADTMNSSLRSVLVTVYQILLSKYSGSTEVCIGMRLAVPTNDHSPVRSRINDVPVSAMLPGYKTFEYAVSQNAEQLRQAAGYAEEAALVWQKRREDALSGRPVFEAGFGFHVEFQTPSEWRSSSIMLEAADRNEELCFRLTYGLGELDATVSGRFADDFLHILKLAAGNQNLLIQELSLPVKKEVLNAPQIEPFEMNF